MHGHVAELADALALGASGETRGGSNPSVPTAWYGPPSVPTKDLHTTYLTSLITPLYSKGLHASNGSIDSGH